MAVLSESIRIAEPNKLTVKIKLVAERDQGIFENKLSELLVTLQNTRNRIFDIQLSVTNIMHYALVMYVPIND